MVLSMEETFAEVSFDFKQPEKENLLVIAPSYSNAINKLVTSKSL